MAEQVRWIQGDHDSSGHKPQGERGHRDPADAGDQQPPSLNGGVRRAPIGGNAASTG